MKITTKKCVHHYEIIKEEYEVRVQMKKGQIITLRVDVEDGEIMSFGGKTKTDTKVIDKLTAPQREILNDLIYEMGIDE